MQNFTHWKVSNAVNLTCVQNQENRPKSANFPPWPINLFPVGKEWHNGKLARFLTMAKLLIHIGVSYHNATQNARKLLIPIKDIVSH